jgi:hypothetical protein
MDMTDNTAGVVTLLNWVMMPDGNKYLYLWAKTWLITTDKEFPVKDLRTSERWQLLAMVGEFAQVILPGCQIRAWGQCDAPPTTPEVYKICDVDSDEK